MNDRRIDLVEEGIDVAVRIAHLKDSSLIARKLFDSRFVVAASPHYLNTHGTPQSPEELSDHDCLVYSNLAEPDRWSWTDERGKRKVVEVRTAMRASSGDFLSNAAAHGLGIVIQWPTSPAYAVYPPTRHLSYRVRAFIDFLVERFAGTPQWDRDCEELNARQT
jgi:DNA-binding transcriptional LysR family regulator